MIEYIEQLVQLCIYNYVYIYMYGSDNSLVSRSFLRRSLVVTVKCTYHMPISRGDHGVCIVHETSLVTTPHGESQNVTANLWQPRGGERESVGRRIKTI